MALSLITVEQVEGEPVVWLEDFDLRSMSCGWGQARARKTVLERPLTIRGQVFAHGVGTHAESELLIELNGCAARFEAIVGVDDEVQGDGSVAFEVWAEGKLLATTGVLGLKDAPRPFTVDLRGVREMTLMVRDDVHHGGWAHGDWGMARIVLAEGAKELPRCVLEVEMLKAVSLAAPETQTALHGPRIVGATPGRPFLFLVGATGPGQRKFSAAGLPAGLKLDAKTGVITGALKGEGTSQVKVSVKGPDRGDSRTLTIVGGQHKLARTPPMGWNSWNCWGTAVDAAKVRAAADAMVASGLAAHGFHAINIDDGWEAGRDANGEILPNEKFPDMRELTDYLHARGLKLGIYSSPGPKTCANFEGSYQHELQDAKTYARWGIDYLKYDWCSYGWICRDTTDLAAIQQPYRVMAEALDACGRDIVYSLCQYGMGKVWEWGAQVGGNLWRTTGDITDTWGSMAGIGFGQVDCQRFGGPGHWNDPDMLVVGQVGWGPTLHPTHLRPTELVTHISLWSLLAAPLLIGCDLTQLDDFTLRLLTNDEVLDVDQDPLGCQAARIAQVDRAEVWARPLADGTLAVGLFNRGSRPIRVTATWEQLGLKNAQPVRDLWQRQELGRFERKFSAEVAVHGAVLVKIGTPRA